jgi:hypothetical protein
MAAEKPIEPVNMPLPGAGGSYIRDDKTGALTRANDEPKVEAPAPAEQTTAKE